jgi:hypothetical protein
MDLDNRQLVLIVVVVIITEPVRIARRLARRVRKSVRPGRQVRIDRSR